VRPRTFVLILVLISSATAESLHIRAAEDAYEKGRVAQRQKQREAAIGFFKEAIQTEPTFTAAREALIQANLNAGYPLEAAAAITQLLQIEPGDVRNRLALAQILLDQHQTERALAQFSTILNIDPNNADALWGFASAARQLGMQARAGEALDRGRRHFPLDVRFKAPADTAPQQQ